MAQAIDKLYATGGFGLRWTMEKLESCGASKFEVKREGKRGEVCPVESLVIAAASRRAAFQLCQEKETLRVRRLCCAAWSTTQIC